MIQQGIKQQKAFTSRSGATSIYVVVVAALLFSIITVSFIRILLRNASNSAANEMAQMAYDSALAGVEDAKTAMMKYRACQQENFPPTKPECAVIKNAIEASFNYASADHSSDSAGDPISECDTVKKAITGVSTASGETLIQETTYGGSSDSATNQAYTCVLLAEDLKDYRSTLSEANTMRVIPLRPKPDSAYDPSCTTDLYSDACRNATAEQVGFVRIDWYSKENNSGQASIPFGQDADNAFQQLDDGSNNRVKPPVLSAQLIQTEPTFSLDDFKNSNGDNSNRSLAYLVPKNDASLVGSNQIQSSVITQDKLADTNDHNSSPENKPFRASCVGSFSDNDFACSKVLQVPGTYPDNNGRNWETFYLILNLPYRAPETDFSIRMYKTGCEAEAKEGSNESPCLLSFSGVQVAVDSTGRANDLYSRVEARIEFTDLSFPFPQYALQATSDDTKAIDKNFYITQDCIKTKRNASGELEVESCTDSGPSD